jgi:hypothetical protein
MKTFLTLCTFAMVSAGIYGFVDMTNDVRHGTMIEYDRGEKTSEPSVTVQRLKMAQGYKSDSYSKSLAVADLKGKILDAKPEVAVMKPLISISDFIGENYSRSMPVQITDDNYSGTSLVTELETDTARSTPGIQPVNENEGTDHSSAIPVSMIATAQPVFTVTDSVEKVKQEIPAEPIPIYEYYGRGNPRRVKKVAIETPAADTTKTVAKKDDL